MAWSIRIIAYIERRSKIKHPLEFIPPENRGPIFWALLVWLVFMTIIMQLVGAPLKTSAAPMGIVSFELAGTPGKTFEILQSWHPSGNTDAELMVSGTQMLYAAFGLGIDYLYMPTYALALSLGILLALGRHKGWFASLGIWLGWGSLVAMLFDATENFALWTILLGDVQSGWPLVAAVCATLKFALIFIGLAYAVVGRLRPKSK
jgi:hypothetical protein